jgi:hypothetical protein
MSWTKRAWYSGRLATVLARLILVVGCGFMAGYFTQPPRYVFDGVKIERQVEGPQYDKFVDAWRVEVARRFPSALVLICHGSTGSDIVTGQSGWYLFPEANGRVPVRVDEMVRKMRAANPKRVIVLLSCNPGHFKLTRLPGVFYALDSIWLWPDKAGENGESMKQEPGVVGNIFEFVSAE